MVTHKQSFSSKFLILAASFVLVMFIKNANCAPFDEAGNELAFFIFFSLLCCRKLFVSLFLMDLM